jgi:hypothetical protein
MSFPEIDHIVSKVFRKPPVLAGEDPADYEELKKLVLEERDPQDLQQVLLTRDIVDAEWEIARVRGLKPAILHALIPRAVKSQIAEGGEAATFDATLVPRIREHVNAMVAGQQHARPALEQMLQEHHLTLDIIMASERAEEHGAAHGGWKSAHPA